MTAPTQPVSINLADFGGPEIDGVEVTATMSAVDMTADGLVVSTKPVKGRTVGGIATLMCFPNAVAPNGLGTKGTTTKFTASIPGSKSLKVTAVVPNQPCNLVDIQVDVDPAPPPPGYVTETKAQSLKNKELVNPASRTAALVDGPSITWDADAGQIGFLTLNTLQLTRKLENPLHVKPGATYRLFVTQHPNGGQDFTSFGNMIVPLEALTPINQAPRSVTLIELTANQNGTLLLGLKRGGGTAPAPAPSTNTAPVNTAPISNNVPKDTAYVFSAANGNAISVVDVDGDSLTTTVSVDSGTLTAVTGGGATITNNGTASVILHGTPTQVNAALNGMSFMPAAGFTGAVHLTIATNDGTATDTDTVTLTVYAPGTGTGPIAFASRADGSYPYGAIPVTDVNRAAAKANIVAHFLGAYDNHFLTNLPGAPAGCMGPKSPSLNGIVNEGVGYWMLMAVVLDGAQTDPSWGPRKTPKEIFDGCLALALARPATQIAADNPTATQADKDLTNHLMAWKVELTGAYQETGDLTNPHDAYSAPDGEMDIAQALLMAGRQWPTDPRGYRNLGLLRIAAMKRWQIRPDATPIAMSRPAGFAGYKDASGNPAPAFSLIRPSDFMFNHFRAFARATQDPFWLGNAEGAQGTGSVYTRALRLAEYVQANLSPCGLMPDFLEIDGFNIDNVTDLTPILPQDRLGHGDPGLIVRITDNAPVNANAYGPEDIYYSRGKDFDSNACRTMWRLGTEVLLSGTPAVKAVLDKINAFIASKCPGNDITLFQDSYKMDGTPGPYSSTGDSPETLGSALVGLCADTTYAALRDNAYTWNFGGAGWRSDGYYSAEIQILSKITAAGFFWEPEPLTAIPGAGSAAPVNTVPSARTITNTATLTFSTGAGTAITVADSDSANLTTTVGVAHGTLAVAAGSGATVTGNNSATVQIAGTILQINAALNGLVYTPTAAYVGSDTLTVTTTDGVTTPDVDTVGITVSAAGAAGGAALLQARFDAGDAGWWGLNTLADMSTDPVANTLPASWAAVAIARWKNHGTANGHDFVQASAVDYPILGTDGGGFHYVNGADGSKITSAGGATTAFYACFAVDWSQYYGTLFSDQDVANHGFRLRHSADDGQFIFSAGNAALFKEARVSNGIAQYSGAVGKVVLECWFDGTNIVIRRNKGAPGSTAFGAAAITAGNADMELFSNWAGADGAVGNTYAGVILKNYCPSTTDRDAIATYIGAQAGLAI